MAAARAAFLHATNAAGGDAPTMNNDLQLQMMLQQQQQGIIPLVHVVVVSVEVEEVIRRFPFQVLGVEEEEEELLLIK